MDRPKLEEVVPGIIAGLRKYNGELLAELN
jgi:hypothetical protein